MLNIEYIDVKFLEQMCLKFSDYDSQIKRTANPNSHETYTLSGHP